LSSGKNGDKAIYVGLRVLIKLYVLARMFSWGYITMGKFFGATSVGKKNADSRVPHPSPHLDHHYSPGRMRRKVCCKVKKDLA
jgi:hypothetical protein